MKKISENTIEIQRDKPWLRMIRISTDPRLYPTYIIQVRSWFKWRDVTFGPFGPFPVGIYRFKTKIIADRHYQECIANGKTYTKRGI